MDRTSYLNREEDSVCACIISSKFRSQGKGKNLILLKLHADFVRDLWLREAAKTHSALVAVQGFIQEKFSILVYPGKKVGLFFFSNLIIWYISIYSTKLAKPYFFFLTDKLVLFWGVRLEKPETKEGAWPTEKEKLNTALCAHPSLTQTSLQTPAVVITIIT